MSPKRKFPHLIPMKEKLQEMAADISACEFTIKNFQKGINLVEKVRIKELLLKELKTFISLRNKSSNEYRHLHIAYCELRGKVRQEIEGKAKNIKKLSEEKIADYKKQYSQEK